MLTYEWLMDSGFDLTSYADFVDCVNDFDMWHLKRDDSLKLNMLFTLLGIERFVKRFMANPSVSFEKEEHLLLEIESESLDKYLKQAEKYVQTYIDKSGLKCGFIFAEKYNSELGNHLIKNLNFDYVIIVNPQRKKVSLRSRSSVDISQIATENGGGGHKNCCRVFHQI